MNSRDTHILSRAQRFALTASFGFAVVLVWFLFFGEDQIASSRSADAQVQKPPMFVLQVGIGKYLDAPKWTDLRGAETDVDEMRKLLEGDRFQVPAANIVTLKNEKATKQNIFARFQDHLIQKAKEHFDRTRRRDAVVLFQYSGHGSQVPDRDNDEDDKLDETLVTYDSRDIKGKNFDVTDDEIFLLTAELKRYTDNIVYIFDSCHSGSGTRNAEDARRLPARTTDPETVPMPGISTRSAGTAVDGSGGGILPPGSDYIVISAAQAEQLATQRYCFEECGRDKEPIVYGLLTYYLIEELRNARADTSYRELMENVVRKVTSERPSQTPLIEGDERRAVFGSIGRAEDNFVPIANVDKNNIRIRSGAIHGVSVGSIVSVYDRATTKFENAEKIAAGRVTEVSATESVVALMSPKRQLTVNDRAVVASSDLETTRSKVLLDSPDEAASSDLKAIASIIRASFEPKNGVADVRGIDILDSDASNRRMGKWNIALLKDKFEKVFPNRARGSAPACKATGSSAKEGTQERDVYYLVGQDFIPLFGFCVEAGSDDQDSIARAASHIERALTHIARYRSIQSVQNRGSRLAGKLVVRPILLSTNSGVFSGRKNCIDGKFLADKYQPIVRGSNGKYVFGTGEVFWFEVTNNTAFDLYVSMLNLRDDGSIKLHFPRNIDGEKDGVIVAKNGGKRVVSSDRCRVNANGEFVEAGAFRTSAAPGSDMFKFLLTANQVKWADLAYLEMDSITRNENASLATNSEWLAIDLMFDVVDRKN